MRSQPWLRFDVGGQSFALPLEVVAEVTSAMRPRLIPFVSPHAAGVVNHRGEPLPALDAGGMLRDQPLSEHRHLIVLDRDALRLGVLVSAVERIERDLRRAVEVDEMDGELSPSFADWFMLDGKLLGLLRPELLMNRARELFAQRIEGGNTLCLDAF